MSFFDVHNHLNQYEDPEKIIAESQKRDIVIFAVSMSLKNCRKNIQLARAHDSVYAMIGLHPVHVGGKKFKFEHLPQARSLLDQNLEQGQVIGIGEIGLDLYFEKKNFERQLMVFQYFLDRAEEFNLGITIHGKNAEKEVFGTLETYSIKPIDIHWYSGPEKYLNIGIERGYYFSVNPAIKYSPKHRRVVEVVPLEQLLTETDGPYPFKLEGKRIEGVPTMIPDLIDEIALIKHENRERVRDQLAQNARIYLKHVK